MKTSFRVRPASWILVFLALALPSLGTAATSTGQSPEGLTASDWQRIEAK